MMPILLITLMMFPAGDAWLCQAAVVACYSSAGLAFGTVTAGVGAPVAANACNAAFGLCSAAFATIEFLLAP